MNDTLMALAAVVLLFVLLKPKRAPDTTTATKPEDTLDYIDFEDLPQRRGPIW